MKYLVEWTPEGATWLVLSHAGPFDSVDDAIDASREPRDGKPNIVSVYGDSEASNVMRELSGEFT